MNALKFSFIILFWCLLSIPLRADSLDTLKKNYIIADKDKYDDKVISPSIMFLDGIEVSNGIIIVGNIAPDKNNSSHRGLDGLILKTDKNGNIVWERSISDNQSFSINFNKDESFIKVIQLSNGNFVTFSESHPKGGGTLPIETIIVSFDSNGNIIWKKRLSNAYGENLSLKIEDIAVYDGGFVAIGNASYPYEITTESGKDKGFRDTSVLLKFDNNGDIIWVKGIDPNPLEKHNNWVWYFHNYNLRSITVLNNYIYLTGYQNYESYAVLVKVDLNGDILWTKKIFYNEEGWNTKSFGITSYNNSIFWEISYVFYGSNNVSFAVIKLDENDNLTKGKFLTNDMYDPRVDMKTDSEGLYVNIHGNSGYGAKLDFSLEPIYTIEGINIPFNEGELIIDNGANVFHTQTSLLKYRKDYSSCYINQNLNTEASLNELDLNEFTYKLYKSQSVEIKINVNDDYIVAADNIPAITVFYDNACLRLESFTALPSNGNAPLDVTLKAKIFSSFYPPEQIFIDIDNDGSYDYELNGYKDCNYESNICTISQSHKYSSSGNYVAKIKVVSGKAIIYAFVEIEILPEESQEEKLVIKPGWNLKALPTDTKKNIDFFTNITTVWEWKNNKWNIYSPDDKLQEIFTKYSIPVITEIFPGEGFWINCNKNLVFSFIKISDYGVEKFINSLSKGWNLVGVGMEIDSNQFMDLFKNILTLWKWENSSWKIWSPNKNLMKLLDEYKIDKVEKVFKGEGFWINN